MEDNRQFDFKPARRSEGRYRGRRQKVFVSIDEFVSTIRRHDTRVKTSEAKSLRDLASRLGKTREARVPALASWARARVLLTEAIRQIDAALEPLGLSLSLSDDAVHGDLAGAVEVHLSRRDGGLPRAMLDIEIGLDGQHRARVFETQLPLQVPLPPIGAVTQDDYQTALMAFVHDIMRSTEPRKA